MMDIEKVIKGLECCKRKEGNECKGCPYAESEYCTQDMATDALALIKKQKEEIDEISDEYLDLGNEIAKTPKVVLCKDCKKRYTVLCIQEEAGNINNQDDWFCVDGVAKNTEMKGQ